jgi:hypothetical protein
MAKLYRHVADLTRDYLERDGRREALERTVTFSIRLTEAQNAKLKFVAERLGVAKSPLAQQLLDAALEETLTNLASHETEEETKDMSSGASNDVISAKVGEYREQIRSIFEEDIKHQNA